MSSKPVGWREMVGLMGFAVLGCDRPPARQTVDPWPVRESMVVGVCEFRLDRVALYHSNAWHLEVKMHGENIGPESAYCGFSAQAMTSRDTALTDEAGAGKELAPAEGVERAVVARETDSTGLSTGRGEGAWVYISLSEGHWPIDTRVEFAVEPLRVRPPS